MSRFESSTINSSGSKPSKVATQDTNHSIPDVNLKVKELPSRALSYPEGCEISYQPYSFGEIKRISKSKNMSMRKSLEEILSGVETSFDIDELTIADALYIGLLRKISTLGSNKVILRYMCGKCKQEGRHTIAVNELEFDEILNEYDDKEACLPIEAEFTFGLVKFNPLRVCDYLKMIDSNVEDDVIAKSAYEADGEFDERYKQFESIRNPQDAEILDTVDKMLFHGLKPVKFNCKNKLQTEKVCDNKVRLELDGGQALIMPFREREDNVKSRIRLGSKAKHAGH